MSAPLSILGQFLQGAFPRAASHGNIVMLSAYFDDAGTHADAPVVMMGGLIGNEAQWTQLEREWKAKLANPAWCRPPLRRFHMTDCEAREGEFRGWKDGEVDALIHDLRQIILRADLSGYICAISRKWNDLVHGNLRLVHGDAEQFCVISLFMQCLEWSRANTVEDTILFVLDDRPHRREGNESVHFAYRQLSENQMPDARPIPLGVSFMSSTKIIPLQAADLVAWEYCNYCNEWERTGSRPPPRPHLLPFMQTGNFLLQYAAPENVEQIAQQTVSDDWAQSISRMLKLKV